MKLSDPDWGKEQVDTLIGYSAVFMGLVGGTVSALTACGFMYKGAMWTYQQIGNLVTFASSFGK